MTARDATKTGALSDEQLLVVYRRAYSVMAVRALRAVALEVIDRPSLDEKIDKVEAYDILSDVANDSDEALAYLEKARQLARAPLRERRHQVRLAVGGGRGARRPHRPR